MENVFYSFYENEVAFFRICLTHFLKKFACIKESVYFYSSEVYDKADAE